MNKLVERFIDKECRIFMFNSNFYEGIIKEVAEGAILVENDGRIEAFNLDFVSHIKEKNSKKNGKKKQ